MGSPRHLRCDGIFPRPDVSIVEANAGRYTERGRRSKKDLWCRARPSVCPNFAPRRLSGTGRQKIAALID